jgi:hypothetical protein
MIPLFEVEMPESAAKFFQFLMEIAAFDIIPTDDAFAFAFNAEPPEPLT